MPENPDVELVLEKAREIKRLLNQYYDVPDKQSLGKMADALQSKLPITLIKSIWRFTGMRNKVVYENETLWNRDHFISLSDDIIYDLHLLGSGSPPESRYAYFTSISVDYDALDENDNKGISIKSGFVVGGLRDVLCQVSAHFFNENDEPLKDLNKAYCTTDGNVCVGADFTPPVDSSEYNDLHLFMPYSELHLGEINADLKFYVLLYDTDKSDVITISEWANFSYKGRGSERLVRRLRSRE